MRFKLEHLLSESLKNEEQVPYHLTDGIRNALQKEKKRGNVFARMGAACAAALVLFTAAANSGATVANAMYEVPVIGELARFLTFRTYEDQDHYFSAYLEIPHAEGLGAATDELNRAVDEYIGGFIQMYETSKEENGEKTIDAETARLNLQNSCDVVTDNDRWFCIEVSTDLVMAGGVRYQRHFTVDKQADKLIRLADLFVDGYDYTDAVYRRIRTLMNEKMAADEKVFYFDEQLGLRKISGEENFYINENDELIITFDEYEVAPGYMGVCAFNLGTLTNGKLAE